MAWGEEHLLVEALHSQWCGLLQQCSAYWNLRIEKTEYSTISQKEKGVGKFTDFGKRVAQIILLPHLRLNLMLLRSEAYNSDHVV